MAEYIEREAARNIFTPPLRDPESLDFWEWLQSEIDAIHAADVRLVVRGRWVGNKRHQSCSECHMTYCVPDGQDGELDMTAYHFCPNCGAMMEES